jgi:hypothetical protein
MLKFLEKILGLPKGIQFEKMKPFDSSPPELVQYQRSIPKGIMWTGVFLGVILFMNTVERMYHPIHSFSNLLQSPFNNLAQILQGEGGQSLETGEHVLLTCLEVLGFIVGFVPSVAPFLLLAVSAIRAALEFFPGIKNQKIPE